MNTEKLNNKLKNDFNERKDYSSLEKYVMSELLTPIEDYHNAVNIIYQNINLLENLNLLYIASYLNSEYSMGYDDLLIKLNSILEKVDDKNKSIIYYLTAYDIICKDKEWKKNNNCISCLKKSVHMVDGFKFVNNRFYLAKCVDKFLAKQLAIESLENVNDKHTVESLKTISQEYWLSSQSFIDEFILGISITDIVYKQKENYLIKLGLI